MTGVLTGAVWGVKGGIAAMLYDHLDFVNKPVYEVIPSFQVPVSKTHFQCIFFFALDMLCLRLSNSSNTDGSYPH